MASRTATIARATQYLHRVGAPRAEMLLIMLLTAGTGLLTSFTLLHLGLEEMPLRYPLAVLAAYGAFMLYLWGWITYRHTRMTTPSTERRATDESWEEWDAENDDEDDRRRRRRTRSDYSSSRGDGDVSGFSWISGRRGASGGGGFSGGGGRFSGGGASGSFGEKSSGLSLGNLDGDGDSDGGGSWAGLGPLLLLLLLVALIVFMTSYVLYIAPGLLAEVFVDGVLATGLYQHLKHRERRHWLATAFRRTWWYFLSVAVALCLAGVIMQAYTPGATSIGEVDFGPILHDLGELMLSILDAMGE